MNLAHCDMKTLQRGRAHVSAESERQPGASVQSRRSLQRGRAHVSAESDRRGRRPGTVLECFNGAALT